jgi:hypothetical protein
VHVAITNLDEIRTRFATVLRLARDLPERRAGVEKWKRGRIRNGNLFSLMTAYLLRVLVPHPHGCEHAEKAPKSVAVQSLGQA